MEKPGNYMGVQVRYKKRIIRRGEDTARMVAAPTGKGAAKTYAPMGVEIFRESYPDNF